MEMVFLDKHEILQHDARIASALAELRAPEHGFEVIDMPIAIDDQIVSLIGIKDVDEERNLGDYQNMSYFLLSKRARTVVIDPGIRQGEIIRDVLGIEDCDVIFTHFHLDHWIGFEPYRGQRFYASQVCKAVLSKMVGIEKTGKSIFVEGRLTDYHRRATPVRAVNDAERLLPIKEKISEVGQEQIYHNPDFNLKVFELPFGQTEGTLYGVLKTPEIKIVFAGDLFVIINGRLRVEPHYAFKSKEGVIADITVALRALLGKELDCGRIKVSDKNLELMREMMLPDKVGLGHGFIDFAQSKEEIEHLLQELEELLRIEREHII